MSGASGLTRLSHARIAWAQHVSEISPGVVDMVYPVQLSCDRDAIVFFRLVSRSPREEAGCCCEVSFRYAGLVLDLPHLTSFRIASSIHLVTPPCRSLRL